MTQRLKPRQITNTGGLVSGVRARSKLDAPRPSHKPYLATQHPSLNRLTTQIGFGNAWSAIFGGADTGVPVLGAAAARLN